MKLSAYLEGETKKCMAITYHKCHQVHLKKYPHTYEAANLKISPKFWNLTRAILYIIYRLPAKANLRFYILIISFKWCESRIWKNIPICDQFSLRFISSVIIYIKACLLSWKTFSYECRLIDQTRSRKICLIHIRRHFMWFFGIFDMANDWI